MSSLPRVILATVFLVGALGASQLSLPGRAVACSCLPSDGGGPFSGEEDAVLMGTVGAPDGRGVFAFTVERWFRGGDEAVVAVQSNEQTLADGSTVINTCGLSIETGQRLILAATRSGATLSPSSCFPHAVVATPEGQQLVAAAVRTFGEGTTPGPQPGTDPRPEAGPDLGLVAIALVTFVVGLTAVAALLAFARRREPPPPDQP